ncbi:hypothetical protein ACEE21_15200 [Clostridium baratii]
MSEIMSTLAREWVVGVSVCIAICLIAYIVFSVLLVRSCRRNGYDVGVSGMIPFVNIFILIKNCIYKRRNLKIEEKLSNMDGEFEL